MIGALPLIMMLLVPLSTSSLPGPLEWDSAQGCDLDLFFLHYMNSIITGPISEMAAPEIAAQSLKHVFPSDSDPEPLQLEVRAATCH
jgi:hypothetical protein